MTDEELESCELLQRTINDQARRLIDVQQRLSEVEAEREKWKGWLINATAALGREGGAFYEDVAGHIRVLLANYSALADAVAPTRRTPEDEELFDIAGLVRQAREDRALAMEYDSLRADQERMREALQASDWRAFSLTNRTRCESPSGFNHPLSSWSLSDWFTATMGELGEAANIAKKLNRVRDGIPGNKQTPEELFVCLASELADTFIYLDLLAQSAGIDLPTAVVTTFEAKSKEIGYAALSTPRQPRAALSSTPTPRPGFDCTMCGHRHQDERFAFICIGCPCQSTPATPTPETTP